MVKSRLAFTVGKLLFTAILAMSIGRTTTSATRSLDCDPNACPPDLTCGGGSFCDPETLTCSGCDNNFPDLQCPCGYYCVDFACVFQPEPEAGPQCES